MSPAHLKLCLPFDANNALAGSGTPDYVTTVVENLLGFSFGYWVPLDTSVSSGTTISTDQSVLMLTHTISFATSMDSRASYDLYKLVDRDGSAHETVRLASYSSGNVTTEDAIQGSYTAGVAVLQRNLMGNGDFECDVVPTSAFWTAEGGSTVTLETATVRQGLRSVKIVSGSAGDGIKQDIHGNNTGPASGTNYDTGQWVVFFDYYASTAPTGIGMISFCEVTGTNPTLGNYFLAGDQQTEDGGTFATSAWNTCCYVIDTNVYDDAGFLFLLNNFIGTGYFDNVHLVRSEALNGKFASNGSGWAASGGAITTGSTQANAHSGKEYASVLTSSTSCTLTEEISFVGQSTKWYMATVYVRKTDNSAGSASFLVRDEDDSTLETMTTTVSVGSDYTKMSVVFAVGSTAGSGVQDFVITLTGASGDTWYVDDFYIIQLYNIPGVIDVMGEEHAVVPSRDQTAALVAPGNAGVSYSYFPANPNEFGWCVRFRPQYSSNDTRAGARILFQWVANANNSVRLEYASGKFQAVWKIGGSETTIVGATASTFAFDELMDVSGWIDTGGRSIGGTTFYGKLFVNGVGVANTTTALSIQPLTNGTVYVGNDLDGAGATAAQAIIDEVYLFVQAPNDNECLGFYEEGTPLHNDNRAFTWNQSIAAGDHIRLDTLTQTVEYYDEATLTRQAMGATTGKIPSLKPVGSQVGWVLISDDVKDIRVIYRKEFV
jgi:hypothetical protein